MVLYERFFLWDFILLMGKCGLINPLLPSLDASGNIINSRLNSLKGQISFNAANVIMT